jgi:hypothetical protein
MPVARSAADILWMATAVTTAIRHLAAQRKGRQLRGLAASQRVRGPRAWEGDPRGVCANTLPRYLGNSKRFAVLTVSTVCRQRNGRPGPCYKCSMPVARSPADSLCLALYALAGGRVGRGFMVKTVADRLGISFERAEAMAVAAEAAGLVRHQVHTVTLTGDGQARGATLTVPKVRKSGGRPSAKPPAPRATPRPRRRR